MRAGMRIDERMVGRVFEVLGLYSEDKFKRVDELDGTRVIYTLSVRADTGPWKWLTDSYPISFF
jgi:hypothetical protein